MKLFGLSPLKSVSSRGKLQYGKRKLNQVLNASSEALSSALDTSMNEISVNNSFSENNYYQKYEYFNTLVEMIKQKLAISSRTEKIKLLTLTPTSWTIKQTKYFGVKKWMTKKARELLQNIKVYFVNLTKAQEKAFLKNSEELLKFFIRMMNILECEPGKKECIFIKIEGRKHICVKNTSKNNCYLST